MLPILKIEGSNLHCSGTAKVENSSLHLIRINIEKKCSAANSWNKMLPVAKVEETLRIVRRRRRNVTGKKN